MYEDIYDFEDINDERVHLPPIDGQTLLEKNPRSQAVLDYRLEAAAAGTLNKVVDLDTETKPLYIARHGQKIPEYACIVTRPNRLPDLLHCKNEHRSQMREHIDHDEIYRSLLEGVHDKRQLERSPQVIEHERRNNIKPPDYQKNHTITATLDHLPGNNRTKRGSRYEEMTISDVNADHVANYLQDIHHNTNKDCQKLVYQPAPPRAPKPTSATHVLKRNRQRFRNKPHAQDTQVLHHVSSFSRAEEDMNHEKRELDALRAQKERDRLQKELEENRKTTKTWQDDSKKRERGLMSKTRRGKQNSKVDDSSTMPVKMRKEMKKLFP